MAQAAAKASAQPTRCEFVTALEEFKRTAGLSAEEEAEFKIASLESLLIAIRKIQEDQERRRAMMYIARLEPFLKSMEQYGKVIEVFVNTSEIVAFIWVSGRRWPTSRFLPAWSGVNTANDQRRDQ